MGIWAVSLFFREKTIGQVTPIVVSRCALHIIISTNSTNSFIVSVVYNSNHFCKQCLLWHELSKISSLCLPLLILRDFNSILHRSEHSGGLFGCYDRKACFFLDFAENNNLVDLNFSGTPFTWCNYQSGLARRWARLDKCLVNLDWIDIFKTNNLKHLNRAFSDHSLFFWFLPFFPIIIGIFSILRISGLTLWVVIMRSMMLGIMSLMATLCRLSVNKIDPLLSDTETHISRLESSDFSLNSQSLLIEHYAKLAAL